MNKLITTCAVVLAFGVLYMVLMTMPEKVQEEAVEQQTSFCSYQLAEKLSEPEFDVTTFEASHMGVYVEEVLSQSWVDAELKDKIRKPCVDKAILNKLPMLSMATDS